MNITNWSIVPVKTVCELIVDCVNRTAPLETGVTPYRMIRTTDIRNGKLNFKDARYVNKNTFERWTRRARLKTGDVLLTREAPIGEVCRIPKDGNYYFLGQRIMQYRADAEKIDPLFLYYSFCSNLLKNQFLAHNGSGSVVSHIRVADCHEFKIPLAPLSEQISIGKILSSLDDKIDLNRRTNETLEAMARALFRDWFVDFGPTRAKMAGQTPYLAPEIWELFPDRLDDEGKPEGWKTAAFSQFVSILTGGTPKTSVADYWDGDIPWFSVVDTPAEGDIYVFDTAKKITKDGLDHSAAAILPDDTVIITARGTVGKLAMTSGPMAMNQSCYGLRGTSGIGQYFIYQSIKNSLNEIRNNSHGSVFDTITRQTFSSISANLPSQETAQSYEKMAAPFFQKTLENVRQTQHLAQLRDLLLPKLMSGEIRIRDAEKMVADAL